MNETTRKFAVHGDYVHPYKEQKGSKVDKIPTAVYKIRQDMFGGFFLLRVANEIQLPSKIYGSTHERCDRSYHWYDKSPTGCTTGLFGSKGAGKTLLANKMAAEALSRGIPVIDVSDSFQANTDYMEFVDTLGEIFVLFDEFLKVLSKGKDENGNATKSSNNADAAQDSMLTFLQGTNNVKRFTVLIDNQSRYLSDYIRDRPGRMRYVYNYEGIEAAVVEAIAKDAGLPDTKIEQLVTYSQKICSTFDQISAVISEWVDYPNETLEDITLVLNVQTVRPTIEEKGIATYKGELPEGIRFTQGTICKIVGSNNVYIDAERKNKYFNQTAVSEKEFENKDRMDYEFDSYQSYLDALTKEWLPYAIGIGRESIKSIFGSNIAYNYGKAIIEVQIVEKEVINYSQSHWTGNDYAFLN